MSSRPIHGSTPPPLPNSNWGAQPSPAGGREAAMVFDIPRSPLSPTSVAPPPTPTSANPSHSHGGGGGGSYPSGVSTATSPGLPGGSARMGSESHKRRSSHSRQPSISLTSSQPSFPAAYSMGSTPPPPSSPISSILPGGAKSVLPPEPVPTRTRAPIESFASVEMLQGQREVQERRRGSEVFRDGRYEGRGIVQPGHNTGEVSEPLFLDGEYLLRPRDLIFVPA